MAISADYSIGTVKETTYKTYVAPTRFAEPVEPGFDWNKSIKQGVGLRNGARVARSARRAYTSGEGKGAFTQECLSKGMGLDFEACLGAGVSTLVAGATYQHLFTLGDSPASRTVQERMIRADGTVDAMTWLGAMVESWELTFANDEIAMLKQNFDIGDYSTAQAAVTPTYVTTPSLYHWANASISTGTLTAPTTIALASAVTATANIRGGSVTVNNNLQTDRQNAGGGGRKAKPTMGLREISGSLDIEYDSVTWRDLMLTDGAATLLVQFTAGALSTGVETLQLVLPEIKIDTELPKPNGTELARQSVTFSGLENTSAQNLWVVMRTSDVAL